MLYRRWPNQAELVIAAVRRIRPSVTPASIPDTGTLRGDVIAVPTRASRWYDGPIRQALHGATSDCHRDPRLAASLHRTCSGTRPRSCQ